MQLIAIAGGLGAEASEHLVRIGKDAAGLGAGVGRGLRSGGAVLYS
jgi:hypothetical protein